MDNRRAPRSKVRARSTHVSAAKTPAKVAAEIRQVFPRIARSTSAAEKIGVAPGATSAKHAPSLLRRPARAVAILAATIFAAWSETKRVDAALHRKLNRSASLRSTGIP